MYVLKISNPVKKQVKILSQNASWANKETLHILKKQVILNDVH